MWSLCVSGCGFTNVPTSFHVVFIIVQSSPGSCGNGAWIKLFGTSADMTSLAWYATLMRVKMLTKNWSWTCTVLFSKVFISWFSVERYSTHKFLVWFFGQTSQHCMCFFLSFIDIHWFNVSQLESSPIVKLSALFSHYLFASNSKLCPLCNMC